MWIRIVLRISLPFAFSFQILGEGKMVWKCTNSEANNPGTAAADEFFPYCWQPK